VPADDLTVNFACNVSVLVSYHNMNCCFSVQLLLGSALTSVMTLCKSCTTIVMCTAVDCVQAVEPVVAFLHAVIRLDDCQNSMRRMIICKTFTVHPEEPLDLTCYEGVVSL